VDQLPDEADEADEAADVQYSPSAAAVFVVQLPDEAIGVRYTSIGCDDDGVFLITDDGEKSRIRDKAGVDCYDDTEDCSFLRLLVLTDKGGHDDEYDISRLPREAALSYGA
jgi:hypothetical protein